MHHPVHPGFRHHHPVIPPPPRPPREGPSGYHPFHNGGFPPSHPPPQHHFPPAPAHPNPFPPRHPVPPIQHGPPLVYGPPVPLAPPQPQSAPWRPPVPLHLPNGPPPTRPYVPQPIASGPPALPKPMANVNNFLNQDIEITEDDGTVSRLTSKSDVRSKYCKDDRDRTRHRSRSRSRSRSRERSRKPEDCYGPPVASTGTSSSRSKRSRRGSRNSAPYDSESWLLDKIQRDFKYEPDDKECDGTLTRMDVERPYVHGCVWHTDQSSEVGCLSGTWKLFKYTNARSSKICHTMHSVETELDMEFLAPHRKQTLFDYELMKQSTPPPTSTSTSTDSTLKSKMGIKFDGSMFVCQDAYKTAVLNHKLSKIKAPTHISKSDPNDSTSNEPTSAFIHKLHHREKYRDCIDLTHFPDNSIIGKSTHNRALCRIKGKVIGNKVVLTQQWRSPSSYQFRSRFGPRDPDLYPCVTRIVGHYDDTCTRFCGYYHLLYPLRVRRHCNESEDMARAVIDGVLDGMFPEERIDGNGVDGVYQMERTRKGDKILVIGRERFLVLREGRCLYYRDYHPHCDLGIPFHDAFHDRLREIYAHHKKFGRHRIGSGVRMMPECVGSTHFGMYNPDHHVLVLGEADFSFTLGLLRAASKDCNGKVGARPLGTGSIIGTSYLCRKGPTKSVYGPQPEYVVNNPVFRQFLDEGPNGELFNILHEIWRRKGRTFHGVDCRQITKTLRSQPGAEEPAKFDRILFPFPRASLRKYDADLDDDLIGGLFSSAQKELSPEGELHIILHTNKDYMDQFDLWGIRDLAEQQGMIWRAALPFEWRTIPPYHPKDVKNNQWRPFVATIHVFTPRDTQWDPRKRAWRPRGENWDRENGLPKWNKEMVWNEEMVINKGEDVDMSLLEERVAEVLMPMIVMPKPASVRNQSMEERIESAMNAIVQNVIDKAVWFCDERIEISD